MSYTIFSLCIVYNSLVRMGASQSQPSMMSSIMGHQQTPPPSMQGVVNPYTAGKKKQSADFHHEGGVHQGVPHQQGGRRGGRKAGRRGGSRRGGSRRGGKRRGTRKGGKRGGKRGGTRKGGKK